MCNRTAWKTDILKMKFEWGPRCRDLSSIDILYIIRLDSNGILVTLAQDKEGCGSYIHLCYSMYNLAKAKGLVCNKCPGGENNQGPGGPRTLFRGSGP